MMDGSTGVGQEARVNGINGVVNGGQPLGIAEPALLSETVASNERAIPVEAMLVSNHAPVSSLSPLPPTATMPPTPVPQNEPTPALPADIILPPVPTPSATAITETAPASGVLGITEPLNPAPTISLPTPSLDVLPDAFPTPANAVFDPVRPQAPPPTATATPALQVGPLSDAMDVDAEGEVEDTEQFGLQSSASASGLKRAGEELNGGDGKRVKEEGTTETAARSLQQDVQTVLPTGNIIYAHPDYVPPPPRPELPATKLTPAQHKHLLNSVRGLKKNPLSGPFHAPVDPVALDIPAYFNFITHPMDLGTVETKLIASDPRGMPKDKSRLLKWDTSKGSYGNVADAVSDVRQIWDNTRRFNGMDHPVSQSATVLEQAFEKSLKTLPSEVSGPASLRS
jgi:bromodomain-containing factor 1